MQYLKIANEIFLVHNFWTPEKCIDFISRSEEKGFSRAPIDTGQEQRVVTSIRNNKRVLYNDTELAETVWADLKEFAPKQIGIYSAIGLNELFRFYRYKPGEEFKRHRDQSYVRPNGETSFYTFMIYLNNDFEGGETSFGQRIIRPLTGMALIFLHDLEHAGNPVKKGTKYVLRTDIMYRKHE